MKLAAEIDLVEKILKAHHLRAKPGGDLAIPFEFQNGYVLWVSAHNKKYAITDIGVDVKNESYANSYGERIEDVAKELEKHGYVEGNLVDTTGMEIE